MISDDQIAKFKTEHGDDIHLIEGAGHEIVVKPPDRPTWKRFRAEQADPAKAIDARERFVRACCVFPDATAFSAMIEKRPGLVETFAAQLLEIAGLTDKASSRKL